MAGDDVPADLRDRAIDEGWTVDAAKDANLAMPAVALVAQQLNALMGQGWGTDDTSSLLRVLEAELLQAWL
jgi:3-hydroxyisobutyrate dehydrogenase-like beta-hydroxyacid dehydrogenase